jgi:signal transduction histidine kinase
MINFWLRIGIRWRLAWLYTGLFSICLSVFSGLLFQYFQSTQIRAFDASLYNFAVDLSSNLEMDFVGRLFVVNSNVNEVAKSFPFHLGGSYLEIRDTRGRMLLPARLANQGVLPLDAATIAQVLREKRVFRTLSPTLIGLQARAPNYRVLTYFAQHADWREPLLLQVAVPLDLPTQERQDLLLFFMLAIPSFLGLSVLVGVWMSSKALKPVHDMSRKAQGITGVDKLTERIPVPQARDELRELAETFNGLLDRLNKAFASQDRFISNASHQLKTPLTILKGELELLGRVPQNNPELSLGLESARAEINRLIRLVHDLLLLARLEAGQDPLTMTLVRLDEVLTNVVSRLQKLANTKDVRIKSMLSADNPDRDLDAVIMGDEELVESMVENFVENAIKYSPVGALVTVQLLSRAGGLEVLIGDEGPGVPEEQRQKMFERFSRGQSSSTSVQGSGLGLSIAAEIARIHAVHIELAAGQDGRGTSVRLSFQRADSGLTSPT